MADGIFRVALADGSVRLAVGDPYEGPRRLVAPSMTIAQALGAGSHDLNQLLEEATSDGPISGDVRGSSPRWIRRRSGRPG